MLVGVCYVRITYSLILVVIIHYVSYYLFTYAYYCSGILSLFTYAILKRIFFGSKYDNGKRRCFTDDGKSSTDMVLVLNGFRDWGQYGDSPLPLREREKERKRKEPRMAAGTWYGL